MTAVLEGNEVTLDRNVDPVGIVLIALASRGRRLLRSAYRLLDAGEHPEAVPLLRILTEDLFLAKWIVAKPEQLGAWAVADHERRDLTLRKVLDALTDDEGDKAIRSIVEAQRAQLAEQAEEWVEVMPAKGSAPPVEVMAQQADLGFPYQLAYRIQSQSDVHATTLAIDSCYERQADGTLRLRPRPVHGLAHYDQYQLGAHILRDLLDEVATHLPGLMWRTGLDGITLGDGGHPRVRSEETRASRDRPAPRRGLTLGGSRCGLSPLGRLERVRNEST